MNLTIFIKVVNRFMNSVSTNMCFHYSDLNRKILYILIFEAYLIEPISERFYIFWFLKRIQSNHTSDDRFHLMYVHTNTGSALFVALYFNKMASEQTSPFCWNLERSIRSIFYKCGDNCFCCRWNVNTYFVIFIWKFLDIYFF